MKHCSNSAGIIRMQEANLDAVRAGIILYGLYPSPEVEQEPVPLKPLMSLRSHIAYIKTVGAQALKSAMEAFLQQPERPG